MRFRIGALALLATGSLGAVAFADDRGTQRSEIDTKANATPFARFAPLATSSTCTGSVDQPFALPPGYSQQVIAQEGDGGSGDLYDMNTQNETGVDAGRYVYRPHEVGGAGQVSVTDLRTGVTRVLAQRPDWERLDGIVWTPWGTLLVDEETNRAAAPDPDAPQATAGLVYELFVDPADPSRLNAGDPRDTVGARDGIAVRPALGSKAHEGMRFDGRGYLYGISESSPGGIFRFVPDRPGDLSSGQLSALRTPSGHDGAGEWVALDRAAVQVQAQAEANRVGANGYSRPEDVETGQSTGVDRNNGGDTLYVAITGTDEVMAVDLRSPTSPYAYDYVYSASHSATSAGAPNAPAGEFSSPDNLALDGFGNLAIAEDPGGTPPGKTKGDDVWVAPPPRGEGDHQPAREVQRFASLRDCIAEPTGIYYAMRTTGDYTEGTPWADTVTGRSLLVNRQHAGQGTTRDQLVAIAPARGRGEEDAGASHDGG